MSQWCHIAGGFTLTGPAFDYKKGKDASTASMPFPEEQFKLMPPEPYKFKFKKDDGTESERSGIKFGVYEYSLPRCKPIVEKLLADLPEGEHHIIPHSFYQDNYYGRATTYHFNSPCEEEYFKDAIIKFYHDENAWRSRDYEIVTKYFGVTNGVVEGISDFDLSIFADLRDCDGEELMSKLEKFIDKLYQENIRIVRVNLAWTDDYERYCTFSITQDLSGWRNRISFNIHDRKDHRIIGSKIVEYTFNCKTRKYRKIIRRKANFRQIIKDFNDSQTQKEQNND